MVRSKGLALVTGATSRLGHALAQELIDGGTEVRAIVRPSYLSTTQLQLQNLPDRVEPYLVDFAVPGKKGQPVLEEACRGIDALYHIGSTRFDVYDYNAMLTINVQGARNVMDACLRSNPDSRVRVIYPSTVSVYGPGRHGVVYREESKPAPASNYAKSKLLAEMEIASLAMTERGAGIKFTILRLGAIYGGAYAESFFRIFDMIEKGEMKYRGSFHNNLSLVHIDDVVSCMKQLPPVRSAENNTYNLTDGDNHTVKQLLECSAEALGVQLRYRFGYKALGIARELFGLDYDEFEYISTDRMIGMDKLRKDTGFKPRVDIKEGVRRLAKEFLQKKKQ